MSKDLRVGFLGFGFIGKVHAYAYRAMPFHYPGLPHARLVAVSTSSEASAKAAQERFGFDRTCADARGITEADDIDVVHVATPNRLHKEVLLSAMAAGKHIYCEKPLVASSAETDEIASALPGYRGTAQMVLQNRFFPACMRARELVNEGFLGEVLSFRACYLHSGSSDPEAPLKWKLSKVEAGGGVLYDLGSHVIDIVQTLVGDLVEVDCRTKVAYLERPLPGGGRGKVDSEDLALITARAASGAIGTIEATKIATGALDELRFEVHGSCGAMRFNSTRPENLEIYDRRDKPGPTGGLLGWKAIDTASFFPPPAEPFPPQKFTLGWLRVHCACLANFVAAVKDGRPGSPGLDVGVALQRTMDACYASAEAHRPVSLAQGQAREQLQMIWPIDRSAPEFAPPGGYTVRTLHDGDESGYLQVMRAAGFSDWSEKRLAEWRWGTLDEGILIAIHNKSNAIVATASASPNASELHPSGGEVGWVAANPEHSGKGLGRTVTAAAVRRLREAGFRRIYLKTDDFRLPAVKTYLQIGFEPLPYLTDMEGRWKAVFEKLGWPG